MAMTFIIDIFAQWFKLKFGNTPAQDAHGRFTKKADHA